MLDTSVLDDSIFSDPPGFGPVEWDDPPDVPITQAQIGRLFQWIDTEREAKEIILIDAPTWEDAYWRTVEVAEWADITDPMCIACRIDGQVADIKGITVGEVLEIGKSTSIAFLLGYAGKGGPGSGNWGHTSLSRVGKGPGGSDSGGGRIQNPFGYLAGIRRGLRDSGPARTAILQEIVDAGWTEAQALSWLDTLSLDKESFTEYGARAGLKDVGAKADAYFAEEKQVGDAVYRKRMDVVRESVMKHPTEGSMMIGVGLGNDVYRSIYEAGSVDRSLHELASRIRQEYGMQVHIGNRWLEEGREQEAHELLSTLYHWAGHDPASATLLRDQVGAVVFRDKPKGTAAMSYNIQQGGKGHIVVYQPGEPHDVGEWVHELGHAAEDYATQQGILDSKDIHARYGIGRLPSSYGWGRPSEDFAECWVAVAGDGYDKNLERWAPEKHADIARVREALAR